MLNKDDTQAIFAVILILCIYGCAYFIFKQIDNAGDYGSFAGGVLGTIINSMIAVCVWKTYYTQQKTENRNQLQKDVAMISEAIAVCLSDSQVSGVIAELKKSIDGLNIAGTVDGTGNRTRSMTASAVLFRSASDQWEALTSQKDFDYEKVERLESCGQLFYAMVSKMDAENNEVTNVYMLIMQSKLGGLLFVLLSSWVEKNKHNSKANRNLKCFLKIPQH